MIGGERQVSRGVVIVVGAACLVAVVMGWWWLLVPGLVLASIAGVLVLMMPRRDPFVLARGVALGAPILVGVLSTIAAMAQLDCTSDCLGGVGILGVSPLTAPFFAASESSDPGGAALALLLALGLTVVWWHAVARMAVELANDREHAWLVFWGVWFVGLVVVFVSNFAVSGLLLYTNIGWIVPAVLQVLMVAGVLRFARRVEE